MSNMEEINENEENTEKKSEDQIIQEDQNPTENLMENQTRTIIKFCIIYFLPVFVLLIAISLRFTLLQNTHPPLKTTTDCKPQKRNLKYIHHGPKMDTLLLHQVFTVLGRMGYEKENNTNSSNWELLWTRSSPFTLFSTEIINAKPYQRINHFPGNAPITAKVDLATSTPEYPFMLPSFKIPDHDVEYLDYAEQNPKKMFIQKNKGHRGVTLKIDSSQAQETFLQEFLDKPFLVDGHKLDIGVYTIITSMDPLRVYIYNGEILMRYCKKKYYPFNKLILEKYVIADTYLPTWEVPSLKHLFKNLGYSRRDSFDSYCRSIGVNPKPLWEKIEDIIRIIILDKEQEMLLEINKYKSKRSFFELLRFDFIVDENLNPYLMEANMSPNLYSPDWEQNRHLYDQLLQNLFSLLGLTHRPHYRRNGKTEIAMVSDKSLAVYPDLCNSDLCKDNCKKTKCKICLPCLSQDAKLNLARSYVEHVYRRDCKRIFPPTLVPEYNDTKIEKILEEYSEENQFQYRWFLGKCQLDKSWC